MGFYKNRIITISSIALVLMIGAFNFSDTCAEENITMDKLIGIWWTHDREHVPWAIQFNEDGTFRTAHTYLRLEQLPLDEGRYQLKGTSLTLISNSDCEGSCKGTKGRYEVGFTQYGQLKLNAQEDQCMERKEVCVAPWTKVLR